jgi:hypothetical protein
MIRAVCWGSGTGSSVTIMSGMGFRGWAAAAIDFYDGLCMKGLIACRQWPAGKWLATSRAESRLLEFFARAEPIQD